MTVSIRSDFPILKRKHRDRELVYLDSAATTQKPAAVINAIETYYREHNANVHRAAHVLAAEATSMMEQARENVATFINAARPAEIIFTRGTTEAINLVANCIEGALPHTLGPGDEILITAQEHHANIVPWQMLCQKTGASLVAVDILDSGDIDINDFQTKLNPNVRLACFSHISNALGTVNPVSQLVRTAKASGAITLVDGAQAVVHQDIDVRQLDCDFYAFSGHKMFGPTGIGVLYGRETLLDQMPPWQGGGEMIEKVTLTTSTYQKAPHRFEAGTPNIAGIIGLGAAIDYLNSIDRSALVSAEEKRVDAALSHLRQIPGLRIVGEPAQRSAVISFLIDGSHPHDLGTLLDQQGVAVRTGHHCAMPLMERLKIPGTVRASFSLYNNDTDVERLIEGVYKAASFI